MFVLGIVTSVHCVSMCGPMVVTYAVKGDDHDSWRSRLVPNAAYQGAKLVSYVLVGLALGAVGSFFSIDGIRPYVMAVAGLFMIAMGLGMTGKIRWAAHLTPRPPKMLVGLLRRLRRKADTEADAGTSSLATPIAFGLATGLMPCAPLQAAQVAAVATGSAPGGGIAMLAFGLGTAPLLFGFGTASSLLPQNLRRRVMTALAVVVIVFGAVYLNRAAMLLGSPVTFDSVKQAVFGGSKASTSVSGYTIGADGVVEVPIKIIDTAYIPSTVQIPADKPVRLVVDRQESGACSDQLALPQLGILVDLAPNAVTKIDLPATKAGNYTLTCGMGMMSGQLVVVPATD